MAAWRHGGLVGGCVWSAGEREVEHLAGRLGQEVRLYTGQVNLLATHSSGRPKQHSKNHLVPANNNTTVDAPLDYRRERGYNYSTATTQRLPGLSPLCLHK